MSLFGGANIASTLIASCARCHASCSVPCAKAVKHLLTSHTNLVWSGNTNNKPHQLVANTAASIPQHSACLVLPNIQPNCGAHWLRFWAQPMSSNEHWAWALRADATRALGAHWAFSSAPQHQQATLTHWSIVWCQHHQLVEALCQTQSHCPHTLFVSIYHGHLTQERTRQG